MSFPVFSRRAIRKELPLRHSMNFGEIKTSSCRCQVEASARCACHDPLAVSAAPRQVALEHRSQPLSLLLSASPQRPVALRRLPGETRADFAPILSSSDASQNIHILASTPPRNMGSLVVRPLGEVFRPDGVSLHSGAPAEDGVLDPSRDSFVETPIVLQEAQILSDNPFLSQASRGGGPDRGPTNCTTNSSIRIPTAVELAKSLTASPLTPGDPDPLNNIPFIKIRLNPGGKLGIGIAQVPVRACIQGDVTVTCVLSCDCFDEETRRTWRITVSKSVKVHIRVCKTFIVGVGLTISIFSYINTGMSVNDLLELMDRLRLYEEFRAKADRTNGQALCGLFYREMMGNICSFLPRR